MRPSVVAIALVAGCGFSEPGDGVDNGSQFEVSWVFSGGEVCEDVAGVPGGATWVEVEMAYGSESYTDAFPCVDGSGVTHAVRDGIDYAIVLRARDPDYNPLASSETRQERIELSGQVNVLEPFVIDTTGSSVTF